DPGGLTDTDKATVTVSELPANVGYVEGIVSDPEEVPIEGAVVLIGTATRTTGADGHYDATLEPGTYDVTVTAAGYTGSEGDVTIETNITSWLNFTLEPTLGTVTGHVNDSADGSGIEYATVVIVLATENKSAITNIDGVFEFEYIQPGEYTITVTASGYVSNETQVTVVAGATTVADLNLTAEGDDAGVDDDGGISSLAMVGIAVAGIAAVGATAFLLMKRKKNGGDDMPPPPVQ
ncbi:MAG: carboxypeptidase regulatory-like domain-containing protein, partial [Thermoplasmata archaeon]|nr:carboxypeptidase regulatory-like domain-containing protein [Thermoplasmata archaeon]